MRGRVRWGNVGRAVAAVAVVALVVAWPRLDGGPLEVPGGAAVPVAPAPPPAVAPAQSPAPPPAATVDPAEREFGFER